MIKKARKHAVVIPTHHDRQEDRMSSKKESCLARIGQGLEQLSAIKRAYTVQQDDQDKVLLHFIERAEEIIKASLLVEALPIPLHILCRVFCEDFFLICWISQSYKAAKEYEDGVAAELAKMLDLSLSRGWGTIRNKHSREPVTREFMETQFLPRLKALKTPRMKIEQIAQGLGLPKLYDILYRASSLDVHANTFSLPLPPEKPGYMALSSINALLDCMVTVLALPRRPYDAKAILTRMRVEQSGLRREE
jgi:hypothetical protein